MTPVAVSTIINKVKILLDENETSNPLVITEDLNQLQYDDIIRACIPDAVRIIHETADSSLLDGDEHPTTGFNPPAGGGKCVITLKTDFMRLVIFRLSNWSRPVTTAILDTSPEYFLQGSKYNGIRGGADKPVCAISSAGTGKILEIYSASAVSPTVSADTVTAFSYLPIPAFEMAGTPLVESIKICSKLVQPVIYQCAGLACVATNDARAKTYFELAQSFLK